MMTCKQASELISRSLDTPLPWPRRARLRVYLLVCRACARNRRQIRQMRLALRAAFTEEPFDAATESDSVRLSASARRRIEESLRM